MIELIILGILTGSFLGIAVMLFRKIPVLVKLPKTSQRPREFLKLKIKKTVKELPGADKFNYELYLQRVLSRVRILTLKTENKTGTWLEKLRQRTVQRNSNGDKYWEELKKAKRGK